MIGCGRWGSKTILNPFLAMDDVTVVAVCDVNSWRMDFTRRKVNDHYAKSSSSGSYKGCKAYGDFRELLADPGIDAVMVSTCDHWHIPAALAAVRAGKDVSVEKPISLSIEEGKLLASETKRLGRVTRNDSEFRSPRPNPTIPTRSPPTRRRVRENAGITAAQLERSAPSPAFSRTHLHSVIPP